MNHSDELMELKEAVLVATVPPRHGQLRGIRTKEKAGPPKRRIEDRR